MLYILFAILFFGFLIAIHEFGHFLTAKLCRVRVNEFSIGMGPLLLKKQGKETLYSLRLLPIGGFCAMEGEDEATDDPRSFAKAPAWRRFLILVAGSGMNFLAGMVILLLLLSPAQAATTAVIDSFEEGCPAAEQGYLQPGDEILRINGHGLLRVFSLTGWSRLIHTEFLVLRATQDTATVRFASNTRHAIHQHVCRRHRPSWR